MCMDDDAVPAADEDVLDAMGRLLAGAVGAGGCTGTLVLHDDGVVAACSEELDGRPCAGAHCPHAGIVSCRDLLGLGGCDRCLASDWGGWEWQHAVRVGSLAVGQRRCAHHRRVTGRIARPSRPAGWLLFRPR